MDPLDPALEECLAGLERALEPETPPDSHQNLNHNEPPVLQTPQAFWEFARSSSHSDEGTTEVEALAETTRLDVNLDSDRLGLGLGLDHSLRSQMDTLREYLSHCDGLRSHLRSAVDLLMDLESQHDLVSSKTNSLHETCKKLLAEQSAFDNVVAEIEAPLTYLRELDRISVLFGVSIPSPLNPNMRQNGTAGSRVKTQKQGQLPLHPDSEAFNLALRRVDECIDYVESNVSIVSGERITYVRVRVRG